MMEDEKTDEVFTMSVSLTTSAIMYGIAFCLFFMLVCFLFLVRAAQSFR